MCYINLQWSVAIFYWCVSCLKGAWRRICYYKCTSLLHPWSLYLLSFKINSRLSHHNAQLKSSIIDFGSSWEVKGKSFTSLSSVWWIWSINASSSQGISIPLLFHKLRQSDLFVSLFKSCWLFLTLSYPQK